jgi:hypothetical protein
MKLARGWHRVDGNIIRELINPFVNTLGWIRESLENVWQPLSPDPGYGGSSRFLCGYSCTPLQSLFKILKSLETKLFLVVLTSRPIVA